MMNWKSIGIVGVTAASIWAAAASGGSGSSSSSGGGSGSKSSGSSTSTAKIGQPASDGKFTFTVNSVKCGIPSVGDTANGLGATAQGQFCDVSLKVANTSTEGQDFSSSDQFAFSPSGSKYSNSTEAEIAAGVDQNILSGINPGNSITTDIYFDIPTGGSIAKFELHDSPFSNGVTVLNQ